MECTLIILIKWISFNLNDILKYIVSDVINMFNNCNYWCDP